MASKRGGGGGPGFLTSAAVLALLAALVPTAVEYAFRVSYPVHEKGGVVVTGASTGIGRHAAVTLAEKGYLVFAGVRKGQDADSLRALGLDNLRPVILDVTRQETVDSAYEEVVRTLQEEAGGLPLVGLVNNAGVGTAGNPVEFEDEASARDVFDVNYWGVLRVTQRFVKLLRDSQGRVINVSSVAGLTTSPLAGTYCASKHALESLSDALRQELALYRTSVSVIQPAYVKTEIFGKQPEGDPRGVALYGVFHSYDEAKQKEVAMACSPAVTSEAILHALADPHPKTRYVVAAVSGIPARYLGWLVWAMPDRVKDALVFAVLSRMGGGGGGGK